MGPVAGLLETAGKKITSVAGKSDVAANPAPEEATGETAASSSKAPQPEKGRRHFTKLALGDSKSPHYRDLGKPYDFPHLKALNYIELRQELLKFAESVGNLCSPHDEPFRAMVKADCNIPGVGAVTLHIEVVEKEMKNQSFLGQVRERLLLENPFERRLAQWVSLPVLVWQWHLATAGTIGKALLWGGNDIAVYTRFVGSNGRDERRGFTPCGADKV
ncbi:hypothetical protein, conserved [Eimeria necatrix]|uniref:Uncharacterized protein n=1 Tax=Eimeria necatrix TaxID=51315 RepID=U6MEM2_9EIME|nr:hypothetical protein, conserved [Eimeria necatrix]CDJ62677.1 hypothetical protein, conserved [Eimeria necatrix]